MITLSDESIEKISTEVASKVCYMIGEAFLKTSCLFGAISIAAMGVGIVVKRYEERSKMRYNYDR
jgi:hypothetical protein